jgi:hypothetical protein
MLHKEKSEYAGQTLKIKEGVEHPQIENVDQLEFRVEDWWDRVSGKSWMISEGNPACIVYAMRTGMSKLQIPTDDEVLYGKIGPFGHLFHIKELELT